MPTIEDLQKTLENSNADIAAKLDAMKTLVTQQQTELAEIKKTGATAPSTPPELAKKIDELDRSLIDTKKAADEARAELEKSLAANTALGNELQKRLDEIEKAGQRPGAGGTETQKSAGEQLVALIEANRETFQAWPGGGAGATKMLPEVRLKGFGNEPVFRGYSPQQAERMKALSSAMSTGVNPASNFLPVMQLPGYLDIPRRQLRIRDLMTVVPTQSTIYRWLRQTGFTSTSAATSIAIARVGTVATVTQAGHGFQDFDLILIAGATQTAYNGNKRITVVDADTYTFTVAGSPATPATGSPTAKRQNNFGAAAFVSEGGTKPEATMSFDEVVSRIEVLAHWIGGTRQVFDDLPGLRASVDNDLLYGLRHREDAALLYGTGTTPQIAGIMNDTAVQTYSWSQGLSGDGKADAIRRARTLVELALYEPSGAVIHPTVWESIETEKGSDGHYMWVTGPAGLNPGGESLWRIPLVVTAMIRSEQFLLGAFGAASVLYDREAANIRFSEFDGTDFIENKVKILAEERIGTAWRRPESFVVGTFDSAPA